MPEEMPLESMTVEQLREELSSLRETCRRLEADNERFSALRGSVHAFISAHPDLGFIFDSEGRYLEIIAPAEDLLFAEYGKLKGRRFHDLYPAEEAERYLSVVRRTIETGQPQVMEYPMQVPAGLKWFEGRTYPIVPSVAELPTVVWISRDITDRKRFEQSLQEAHELLEMRVRERTADLEASERALRRSQQWLESIIANVPGALYRLAPGGHGTIEMASPPIRDISGLDPKDFVGGPAEAWTKHIHPDDLPGTLAAIYSAMAEHRPYEHVYRVLHRDGSIRWVEDRGRPTFEPDGQLLGFDGLILDITGRREAELALQESQRRLESIVANVPGVLYRIGTTLEGTIEMVSPVIEAMVGVKPSDIIGTANMTWTQFIHPEDVEQAVDNMRRFVVEGRPYRQAYRVVHRTGAVHWVEDAGRPFFDDEGQVAGCDGVILDITPRVQAEQALQDLHRQRISAEEQYRQSVARDLHDSAGQKLVAMMLRLRNLDDGSGSEGCPHRAALYDLAESCADLVREIRAICHGLYPPLLEERGLVLPLQGLVGRYIQGPPRLTLEIDPSAADRRFDREVEIALFRLTQEAINNIVTHSGAETGCVRLSVQDGQVVLEIEDDGRGISPQTTHGLGMRTMADRMRGVGGTLKIDSCPGRTCITASVKLT